MRTSTRSLLLAAALLLPTTVACSETIEEAKTAVSSARDRADDEIQKAKDELDQGTEDLRVSAIEAAVVAAAPARFSTEGYEIDGELACTAESPALETFSVSCTGTTTDGGAVTVIGQRPVEGGGDIVGSVDDTEVFTAADCFGLC